MLTAYSGITFALVSLRLCGNPPEFLATIAPELQLGACCRNMDPAPSEESGKIHPDFNLIHAGI